MSSFTFIPRSVKKKTAPFATSSNPPGSSVPSSRQREVSSTTPVAQTSTLARPRSERVVSTDQNASSETLSNSVDSKGKSRETNPPGRPSENNGALPGGPTGSNVKPTATKTPDFEELASLACLALSDYQIWADTTLRRKIDWGSSDDSMHQDDTESTENTLADDSKGCMLLSSLLLNQPLTKHSLYLDIPLDYLVHHSPVFQHINTAHPETLLVKAIRAHAAEFLDVRLVLASEETAYGNERSKKIEVQTGYQVRRRTPPMEKPKSQWDNLTIYFVCYPPTRYLNTF